MQESVGGARIWDGKEAIDHYCGRLRIEPKSTISLNGHEGIQFVLIPNSRFNMGAVEPTGAAFSYVGFIVMMVAVILNLGYVVYRSRRRKSKLQLSLFRLVALALSAAMGMYFGSDILRNWRERSRNIYFDSPAHEVTIRNPFYITKYEITQSQFANVMGYNPSHFLSSDPLCRLPVESVTWEEAVEFCHKLSELSGLRIRLPTEAEWEFACRGNPNDFKCNDKVLDLPSKAWYKENSGDMTNPVGQKQANEFGVYDMLGNVGELCGDWYAGYSKDPAVDPIGPLDGAGFTRKVFRGGTFKLHEGAVSPVMRGVAFSVDVTWRAEVIGIRVVMEVDPEKHGASSSDLSAGILTLPSNIKELKSNQIAYCPLGKPIDFPTDLNIFLPVRSEDNEIQPQLQVASALLKSPAEEERRTALRWLIHQPDCSDVVRNELLNTLRAWKPEWLTGDLARMSTDPAQNKVWRSYCIQHLGHIYGATKDEAALKAIQDATNSEEPAVRDQAIFSLGLLAKQLDWAKADPKAQEAFNSDLKRLLASETPSSQASALRAIAHAEVKDFALDVEALAKNPKQPLQVRVAAVQALGQIGRPESVAVLESCAKEDGSKKRLTEQAELQLGRLKEALAKKDGNPVAADPKAGAR